MPINPIENIPPLKEEKNKKPELQKNEGGEKGGKSYKEIEEEVESRNKKEESEPEAKPDLPSTLEIPIYKKSEIKKRPSFTDIIQEELGDTKESK